MSFSVQVASIYWCSIGIKYVSHIITQRGQIRGREVPFCNGAQAHYLALHQSGQAGAIRWLFQFASLLGLL
jgi:hypothetical protein